MTTEVRRRISVRDPSSCSETLPHPSSPTEHYTHTTLAEMQVWMAASKDTQLWSHPCVTTVMVWRPVVSFVVPQQRHPGLANRIYGQILLGEQIIRASGQSRWEQWL